MFAEIPLFFHLQHQRQKHPNASIGLHACMHAHLVNTEQSVVA